MSLEATCSSNVDLKAYVLGEAAAAERGAVEDHLRVCESCREELDRLKLTQAALASLPDEEIPQRIAFVSDRVFEPRWWQTMWRSGPVMGFASAVVLAAAILAHGFGPAGAIDAAQIEKRVDAQVNARVAAAVTAAVGAAQAKQSAEFAKELQATEAKFERQRQDDLADVEQYSAYLKQQMARFEVASNGGYGQ
jgi:anti-sigma factor RsiW